MVEGARRGTDSFFSLTRRKIVRRDCIIVYSSDFKSFATVAFDGGVSTFDGQLVDAFDPQTMGRDSVNKKSSPRSSGRKAVTVRNQKV